ncbi:SO2930 family diheme c-type cytochrome [Neolewinella maritima]|nr:SO2930 family diheme c-type cytochrome [Neolewinella maritima]
MRYCLIVLLLATALIACDTSPDDADHRATTVPLAPAAPEQWDRSEEVSTHGLGEAWLSDYGFFTGRPADLQPAPGVIPYEVGAPLFSDYAGKARFVYLPEGTRATYHPTEVFDFPVGTVLIKNFYYDTHAVPVLGRRLLETRLLVRTATEWRPLSYVWDEAQTDARFTVLGARLPVDFVDVEGTHRTFDYAVPDLNQCKNCHAWEGTTRPIGPSARQLNTSVAYADGGTANQLDYWTAHDLLTGAPAPTARPAGLTYAAETTDTDRAARAYLDANCGHCHRPEGSAKTSGLDLTVFNTDAYRLGIAKPPVAAGRASGNLRHSIVPGHPEESILLYRMASAEVGVAMPELGRRLVDERGVELVASWIRGLE